MNDSSEILTSQEVSRSKSTLRKVGEAALWVATLAGLTAGAVYLVRETGDIGPLFDIPGVGVDINFEPQNGDPVMGS